MTRASKITCGIILLTIPTIIYGGYFLLTVLSGQQQALALTEFQRAMFRAGHAHAGVLVILSLIAQILADHSALTNKWKWMVRISFPIAAVTVSLGFFASAIGQNLSEPNAFVVILYGGMAILTAGLLVLGVGMIRVPKA